MLSIAPGIIKLGIPYSNLFGKYYATGKSISFKNLRTILTLKKLILNN